MILLTILSILLLCAILSALGSKLHSQIPRFISVLGLLLALGLASVNFPTAITEIFGSTSFDYNVPWIAVAGANFHLSADGLSLLFIVFTLFLGVIGALLTSKISNPGYFFFHYLLLLSGIVGIFMAADLLLFFFFWEMMLLPMYFLMIKYRELNDQNENTPFKFLLYTQVSGLLMLLGILALFFIHGRQTSIYSFELSDLMQTTLSLPVAIFIMTGFVLAFLVKLPVIPFHGWMPATFSASPLAVIFTGILVKTGAYGILRLAIPLFPEASVLFAPTAMAIGIMTILYAGLIAFSSNDIRKIAAYSSISHTGFIIIGLYAFNILSWHGVIFQMIASAIGVGGLALLGDALYRRTGTYDITGISGLWSRASVFSGFGLVISLAILGLPGLANFIAEFLILAGTFQQSIVVTILASIGIVIAAAYALRIVQKVYVGEYRGPVELKDLSLREKMIMSTLVVLLLVLGLYTRPIIRSTEKVLERTLILDSSQPEPLAPGNDASVKYFVNPQID
ncbi:MAG: NADH-quinone oxidoreductase subunit M [Bacteroidales bacterium]|nr:NADH-quinone oxidoreductase subunit M [Bacteroidales bacterium]